MGTRESAVWGQAVECQEPQGARPDHDKAATLSEALSPTSKDTEVGGLQRVTQTVRNG